MSAIDEIFSMFDTRHYPVRFEIVEQAKYNVYGFEKDSTLGVSYGSFGSYSSAKKRLDELEKYYIG